MSGSGTCWTHFTPNHERNQWVHSKCAQWPLGWAHCERNLDEWLRSHASHIVSHISKETHGFFHKVPTGHLAEYIVKELNMYLAVTCWLNCLRNHNVITMEILGKWGFAPSVSWCLLIERFWSVQWTRGSRAEESELVAKSSLEGKSLTCLQRYRVTEEGRGFPEILRLRSYLHITNNYIY